MGFKDVREKVTHALKREQIEHAARSAGGERDGSRNHLRDGLISCDEVWTLLVRFCDGTKYETDRHDFLDCDVHIFKPVRLGERWYIKAYFMSDLRPLEEGEVDVMFISVHPSVHGG